MSPKKKARRKVAPLHCAKCKSTSVTVSGVQQMLRRKGAVKGKTEFARVTCDSCGHEWWSRHPDALKLSRQADAARESGTGTAHIGT